MPIYDSWAKYYDLIHDGLPGDVDFYVKAAATTGGPALEIGVGTGRVAIAMAQAGIDVTGLDNSAAMLSLCHARKRAMGRAPGRLTLVRADMRDFALGLPEKRACFRFVAMPYRTFMHLLTREEQRACLLCIRRHMASNATFVLDTWVPDARFVADAAKGGRSERLKRVGRFRVPGQNLGIEHYQAYTCDEFHQCMTEIHVFREIGPRGKILNEDVLPLARVWSTRREMENLLLWCGFRIEAVYADFAGTHAGNPTNRRGTTLVWVLTKDRLGRLPQ